ncbi:MAG: hypothetical protein AB1695_11160 [Stygiobacter sp.]|jgi:hypothetical protein|uniref:Uncharacterized protein n=1 Tax=Stygiobacter electus TaxID=3032292 RepID=A0AAE3P021_9BACT|nr:hypothetical protein [Stygiobacter electus]MDF1611242.1 hypothetical protein [Stygiobacter electus]
MNKIILNFGLLVFFFSIIFFTQKGLPIEKVLLNSFAIFILLTTMLSLIVIGLIKAINKNSLDRLESMTEQTVGNKKHE